MRVSHTQIEIVVDRPCLTAFFSLASLSLVSPVELVFFFACPFSLQSPSSSSFSLEVRMSYCWGVRGSPDPLRSLYSHVT